MRNPVPRARKGQKLFIAQHRGRDHILIKAKDWEHAERRANLYWALKGKKLVIFGELVSILDMKGKEVKKKNLTIW